MGKTFLARSSPGGAEPLISHWWGGEVFLAGVLAAPAALQSVGRGLSNAWVPGTALALESPPPIMSNTALAEPGSSAWM